MTKIFTHSLRVFAGGIFTLALCSLLPADILQEIEKKFEDYKGKYPSTKINMIFNQPVFAPGDTAFFSAWYQDEELLPVKGDHIVTLDLINGSGVTVQKLRFKTRNGRGANQIVFKTDLPPAEYKFVAYTDWMRNFGEAWFYQKSIQLVSRRKIQTATVRNDISIYPEGGNLVEGLSNNIVVLGPASSEVIIKRNDNVEVVKILIDSTGISNFTFTPLPDYTYSASLSSNKNWTLPSAIKDGLTVKMILHDTVQALLSLPANSKWANKELYAIITSKGKIVASRKISLSPNEMYRLQLPLREKSEAYHQLYIFDSNNHVLAERIFIQRPTSRAHASLQVASTAKQREPISFVLTVKDDLGYPVEADMTVTVLQKQLFDDVQPYTSFYLSDLPQAGERVEKFGTTSNLNNFLITQKWQRLNWNSILGNQTIPLPFPFQSLITLTGQIVSKTSGTAPPDSTTVVSYLQKNTIGYEGFTKKGKFSIPIIFDFWGDDQIFLTLQRNSKILDSEYSIVIAKDSLGLPDRWSSTETAKTSPYGEFAFNKRIIANSYSFFGSEQNTSLKVQGSNSSLEEEFQGADATIKIADYVLFPTMEDLLREVVPFVQFQKRGSKQNIRMTYRYERSVKTYGDDPLYVIDGFMSRDTPFFLSIKPENLLAIKIINNPNKLGQLGKLGENGIIFVESKKGNLFSSVGNNLFPIAGLSKPVNFDEMDYLKPNKNERVPDLRANLYWTPAVIAGKLGSTEITCFASDDTGPIIIRVEGLTKDGVPFQAEKTIDVKYNSGRP